MYTLINGSQKVSNSNSLYFLKYIGEYLTEYDIFDLKKENYKDILDSINISESIVIAFPLYADSPSSIILKFLDYIYDNQIDLDNKRLYVVINCGFREGKQNITALNIIKNYCKKANLRFSGGLLIGAGEIVGKPNYKFITKNAHKSLHEFSVSVSNNKPCNDIITTMDLLTNRVYCMFANHSWTKSGRKYKLSKKDICAK